MASAMASPRSSSIRLRTSFVCCDVKKSVWSGKEGIKTMPPLPTPRWWALRWPTASVMLSQTGNRTINTPTKIHLQPASFPLRNWTSWRLYLRDVSINRTNKKDDLLHIKSSWQTILQGREMLGVYQVNHAAGTGNNCQTSKAASRNRRKAIHGQALTKPMPSCTAPQLFEDWSYQVVDWSQLSMINKWKTRRKSSRLTGVYTVQRRCR